jgi:hypothetical protein
VLAFACAAHHTRICSSHEDFDSWPGTCNAENGDESLVKFPVSSSGAVQSKFRAASVAVVAAADCNSVSVGLDAGHYEGPLRIRLPVKLSPGASAEGAWSFEVPLPNPASQKLLSRCD